MTDNKDCFVIAPIGEPESDTRKRSDQVLNYVIKPAVAECGYNAIRADEIDKPGIITSQVIQHVVNDRLVIADLTERNPNVFYELAIRHAISKTFIQIMKKGEQLPFDVAATRTIFVDHQDLDNVAAAKTAIAGQIHELEKGISEKGTSDIETPISVSLDLQFLRQSERPEDRSLADLVAVISNIRGDIGKIEGRLEAIDHENDIASIRHAIGRLPKELAENFGQFGVHSPRRKRAFHPMVLEELLDMGAKGNTGLEVLILAGFCREIFPWIHELAIEAYRFIRANSKAKARVTLVELQQLLEFSLHSSWGRESIERDESTRMVFDHLRHRLDRIVARYNS